MSLDPFWSSDCKSVHVGNECIFWTRSGLELGVLVAENEEKGTGTLKPYNSPEIRGVDENNIIGL